MVVFTDPAINSKGGVQPCNVQGAFVREGTVVACTKSIFDH